MLWNTFISKAQNATFLFHRDFMDYHSNRFNDFSLLIFKDSKLLAVLPANKINTEVQSHQGLTYGGLVFKSTVKTEAIIAMFLAVLQFLDVNGISKLKLKTLPSIYCKQPSDVIKYLAFKLQARLYRCDMLSVINYSFYSINMLSLVRNRGVKRAKRHGLKLKEEKDFEPFWEVILKPNLKKRFNTKPVHSCSEIELLAQKFPKNIRQFNVYKNEELVAGATIFETQLVAHVQYISGNEKKQELGSLDFLFQHLITTVFKHKQYFDFGISNDNDGQNINKGLLYWKESFGARTITQEFYSFNTKNYMV